MLIFTKGKTPLFSSGKDDWETPDWLFQEWHKKYHFILDAAANKVNHKVPRWFGPGGEQENALTTKWPLMQGNIWLNPPYSKQLQKQFVRKAWAESENQWYSVVCLLPARTDTKLFHEVIQPHAKVIHFLPGRIKFVGAPSGAPFPSMIVVL
jgi:site-specific DNA-methyltransferase (adenine-specific)